LPEFPHALEPSLDIYISLRFPSDNSVHQPFSKHGFLTVVTDSLHFNLVVGGQFWMVQQARMNCPKSVFVCDLGKFDCLHFEIPQNGKKRVARWISAKFLPTTSVTL
jgi:hypothetical protein